MCIERSMVRQFPNPLPLKVGSIGSAFLQHKRYILATPKCFFTTTTRRHDVLLRTTRRKRRAFGARSAKNVVSSCRRGEKNKQRSCVKALSLEPTDPASRGQGSGNDVKHPIFSNIFHLSTYCSIFTLLVLLMTCSFACQSNENPNLNTIPYSPHALIAPQPPSFPPMVIPKDNPLTREGVSLGRKLFFDPILSQDSSISCRSCHLPERAFTDGTAFSKGFHGRRGKRSAMSLLNVGFYAKGLFWDGRVATLEEQSLHPVRDSLEMGASWANIGQKLQKHPEYPRLFRRAFGIKNHKAIDSTLVGKALAQFERTLVSANTKFDRVMQEKEQFTAQEKRGWTIFFDASPAVPTSECNHCHVDPLFSTLAFENNGLVPALSLDDYADKGRGVVTGNRNENGLFRVPTLRNLKYTAPYMHDGRFKTLEEVLDHYASGGHPGINVSPNVRQLHLSKQDRADLIAFLNTLNDEQ